MKTLFIAMRILAFLTLLFVPAFVVLLLVAFVIGQALWFTFIGVLALFVNAVVVFAKPQRDRVWHQINVIAGTKPRR